ncbi:MAG TPA: alpha/beta hydrolase-fold protein [Acidiferrobacterales bacterium]
MTPDEESAEPVEIVTGRDPTGAVIWLHGLGADGHDFEPIVPELGLPRTLALRFVFPHAPYRAVTLNNGYVMRAWYDMEITDSGFNQKATHIQESVEIVGELIEREIARGIPVGRIVLAGFSQGGAIALVAGLRHPQRLAGILALSVPVPFAATLMRDAHAENRATPIFMAHGTHDGVVPYAIGHAAHNLLKAAGANIEWHEYPMEHAVHPQEIKDIGAFLQQVLEKGSE